jgi:hypothetical protein
MRRFAQTPDHSATHFANRSFLIGISFRKSVRTDNIQVSGT